MHKSGETAVQPMKLHQILTNTHPKRLLYSLLHMTFVHALFVAAVCVVFVGGIGVVDKVVRMVCGAGLCLVRR